MKLEIKQDFHDIFKLYFQKKMLKIFLLGIISGLPWVFIGSCLSLWLKENDLSRSTIGWSGLIFSVFAINYLWAPLVDRIRIPFLTNKIGHRKSWIFLMQSFIALSLMLWYFFDPNTDLFFIILIGLIIAISSCTQDISIDALRIEQFRQNERNMIAAGASVTVIGWWTGFKIGGFLSLSISHYLESLKLLNYWQITFIIMSLIVIILNLLLLTLKENDSIKKINTHRKLDLTIQKKLKLNSKLGLIFSWLSSTTIGPILSFFKKNGLNLAISILIFIFLFKIGEAFLGRMSVIFYKEIGFSKSDIGIFSKGIGWITTITFTILGGFLTIKAGVIRAVFYAGIMMAATNLMFCILAWYGKSYFVFSLAIILDDIAAAFATVAFVAFISLLVDRNYTATQYALLASIGTLGRTTLSSSSGNLVDHLNGDWGLFFIITSLMVIPSLIILILIKKRIKI